MQTPSSYPSSNQEFTVIVWDHQKPRIRLINSVVSACGGKPLLIECLADIDELQCSTSQCTAIVAIGTIPTEDTLGLDVIHRLKHLGFYVISHEQGTDSWALSLRCRPLLAGSICILNSDKTEFTEELQRTILGILAQNVCKLREVVEIKALMNTFGITGESEAMLSIFRQLLKIGPLSDLPVLITGESGTGKELIARAIHRMDPKRCDGPFVAVNCGAISLSLAETELFGHKRGAFTGADRDRGGLIRSAHGGVLFLDEIGELNGCLQTKLLRVLQDNRVMSVGDDQEVFVDFRIIAATNRNLEWEIEQGEFRADLFHRINVLSLFLCPLRERIADIKPLIEQVLVKYRSIEASSSVLVGQDFIEAVASLKLSGNARELENLVLRALLNKQDNTPLGLNDLPSDIWQQLYAQQICPTKPLPSCEISEILNTSQPSPMELESLIKWLDSNGWDLNHAINYCERLVLEAALHQTHGNQTESANLLGITPRSVYSKLRKHHLGH